MPTPILEVSFGADPLSGAPAWTDISAYLRSFSTRRARQGDLGRWEAGTATFTLANADRRFEPYYTSGAYSPNVIPRRRIRVRTATYPIFDGFVDGWAPTYPAGGKDAICTVRATDMFKLLANIALQVPYVREVLLDAPTAYYRLNETASTQLAADSSGNGRNGTYSGGITFSQPDPITDDVDGAVLLNGSTGFVLTAGQNPAVAGGTFSAEVWFKILNNTTDQYLIDARDINRSEGWALTITNAGFLAFAGLTGASSTPGVVDDGNWHQAVVTFDGTNGRLYLDGALADGPDAMTVGAANFFELIGSLYAGAAAQFWNGSVDEVSFYSTVLSASRVATHYASRDAGLDDTTGDRITRITNYAGIPLAMTTVPDGTLEVTGAGNLGSQKALTAIQDAEATEAGSLFVARDGILTFVLRYGPLGDRTRSTTSQATFGDQAGEVGYRTLVFSADDEDLANTVTVTRRNGGTLVARSAAAEAKYGPISRGVSSIGNSDAEAQGLAEWLLDHLADPGQLRVKSMTFALDGTNDAAILDRELHDRVTVKWTPPGGGARISQEALITGISWAAAGLTWTCTLEVSPTETRPYWIWGTSTWGETTRWAA
jgi:hypothetical protein